MKLLNKLLLLSFIFICGCGNRLTPNKKELVAEWDTVKVIENPNKGWYHHMLDNGVHRYLLDSDSTINAFPGMDHLYLRLCWAFLEPEEGKYNWSYIDDIVNKYVPMGYKISFRISCKETGPAPTSVPYEVDCIRYATPIWVKKAGAKGVDRPEYGTSSWTPDWDDSIFLSKLNNFHKAFADKYDGKEWVRYIDIGSIGDWGEGHTYSSTRTPVTYDEIMTHINLYLKHYKKTQLIVTDDLLANSINEAKEQQLLDYVFDNGISLRDDSPMVEGYMKNDLETWTVRYPEMFSKIYKYRPTIFELEHYGKVKSNNYWIGKDGSQIIPDMNVSGAEVFINAVKLIHPTYIGYHGYMKEWLEDNPVLTGKLLNLCGYWYFPVSISTNLYKDGVLEFEISWINKGVAPAYKSYQLIGRLIDHIDGTEITSFDIDDSGNMKWMPGVKIVEKYAVPIGHISSGKYDLMLGMYDRETNRIVDFGLNNSLKHDGLYYFTTIEIND